MKFNVNLDEKWRKYYTDFLFKNNPPSDLFIRSNGIVSLLCDSFTVIQIFTVNEVDVIKFSYN